MGRPVAAIATVSVQCCWTEDDDLWCPLAAVGRGGVPQVRGRLVILRSPRGPLQHGRTQSVTLAVLYLKKGLTIHCLVCDLEPLPLT